VSELLQHLNFIKSGWLSYAFVYWWDTGRGNVGFMFTWSTASYSTWTWSTLSVACLGRRCLLLLPLKSCKKLSTESIKIRIELPHSVADLNELQVKIIKFLQGGKLVPFPFYILNMVLQAVNQLCGQVNSASTFGVKTYRNWFRAVVCMLAALRIQLSVVAGSIWHCSKVGATFLKVNDFFWISP